MRHTPVSEEIPLTIEVNGEELATLLCSPTDLTALAVGFLFSSGIVNNSKSIGKVVIDRERWKASTSIDRPAVPLKMLSRRVYTSGCGKGIIYYNPLDLMLRTARLPIGSPLDALQIAESMKAFLRISTEHRETRGVHSCALASSDGILFYKDDIGRHNALDKIIGEALLNSVLLEDKVLLSSGRVSSEIVSKVLRSRIPVVVSAGAPTNQAVKLSQESNLTLICLARGPRMIIFSGEERIR